MNQQHHTTEQPAKRAHPLVIAALAPAAIAIALLAHLQPELLIVAAVSVAAGWLVREATW